MTPVNMASYDTWIKQYRPDENTANTTINYYPKGAVIAFLLDAKIRKATNGARSLDTGMQWAMQRYSGDKGYTPDQFYAVMSEVAGTDLKAVVREGRRIHRRARLHRSARLLRPALPSRSTRATRAPVIGGGTRNDSGRLIVTSVRRGTPAIDAGLNVDDEILAIDDVRVRADGLAARLEQYKPGDKISVLVARRDRLMKLDVTLGAEPGRVWRLEPLPDATRRTDGASERVDGRQVTVTILSANPGVSPCGEMPRLSVHVSPTFRTCISVYCGAYEVVDRRRSVAALALTDPHDGVGGRASARSWRSRPSRSRRPARSCSTAS